MVRALWPAHASEAIRLLGIDRSIVASFVASRLLILVAAFVAEFLLPRNPALTSGDGAPILRSLTSWDGWYYLGIARDGYHADPIAGDYRDIAFLPLYPFVIRLLSTPWPDFAGLVSVLISNVAFLVSLGLLARLGERHLGRRRAVLAASLLAVYPFASVFAMAYTESLFLALMTGSFLAAERGRRPLAAALLGLSCLARFQGLVLVIPLALLMLRQDGWRPRASLISLAAAPLAVLAFMAFIGLVSGSATAYFDAQVAWGREGLGGADPDETIAAAFSAYQAALLAALGWAVFLLVYARPDGLPLEYTAIPVLFIAAELSSGSLEAVGRVTMLAFPYVWLLANRRGVFVRRAWPVLSAGLFTVIAVLSFVGAWVP